MSEGLREPGKANGSRGQEKQTDADLATQLRSNPQSPAYEGWECTKDDLEAVLNVLEQQGFTESVRVFRERNGL